MADAIAMTDEQRTLIREMRGRGISWELVGSALGVSRSRAITEGASLGLVHVSVVPPKVRVEREARGPLGGDALAPWHPICRAVLAEAGLPVPRVGEVW